jgi:hypothetical protein
LAFAVIFVLAFIDTLQDARDLIEVHGWRHCWYRNFPTYVAAGVAISIFYLTASLASWLCLRSARWKLASVVLSAAGIAVILQVWSAIICGE